MRRVTTMARNGFKVFLIALALAILCSNVILADEQYWQVKDMVAEANVIAIATVKQLRYDEGRSNVNDLMDVDFSVNMILKRVGKDLSSFTLAHPAQKRQMTDPRPISFIAGGRYLVFLKYADPSRSVQSLQLISPTSGAVQLQGNETISKPHLLDGYPGTFRRFNEPELLQRVQQLISIFELLRHREVSEKERTLIIQGYSTDTPEHIIQAAKSESFMVRLIALEMLTEQSREKAIPTLKEALGDPEVEIRWRAAHWLGTLGDKSGLDQMRRDLKELAPNDGAPEPLDPNMAQDSQAMKKRENERNNRLYYAIKVAKVLAELGDWRGYQLAARRVLEQEYRHRYNAVPVLVEIAKTDEATLRSEGLSPISILCAMAESEKNEKVFKLLISLVATELRYDVAIRILEIAEHSQNQSQEARQEARQHIDAIKLKKEASEDSRARIPSPLGRSDGSTVK